MASVELRGLGYPDRTVRRWAHLQQLPHYVALLVRLMRLMRGELGLIDPAWTGWRLKRGELFTPESVAYTPSNVRAIWFRMQQIDALERQMTRATLSAVGYADQCLTAERLAVITNSIQAIQAANKALIDALPAQAKEHWFQRLERRPAHPGLHPQRP